VVGLRLSLASRFLGLGGRNIGVPPAIDIRNWVSERRSAEQQRFGARALLLAGFGVSVLPVTRDGKERMFLAVDQALTRNLAGIVDCFGGLQKPG
jgi:hypothetical protein